MTRWATGAPGGPSPRLDVSVGSERQVPPESSESAPAEANWLVGGWFALSRHFSGAFRQTPRGRVPTTNKGAFLNVQNGSHVAQAGGDAADCQCGLQVLGREVWPVEQDVAGHQELGSPDGHEVCDTAARTVTPHRQTWGGRQIPTASKIGWEWAGVGA